MTAGIWDNLKGICKETWTKNKKKLTVYTTIPRGRPPTMSGARRFVPVFDSTDHFHFACSKCKTIAGIVQVQRRDSYADTPTIYFYLVCPFCGLGGQRKIYLEKLDQKFLGIPTKVEALPLMESEHHPECAYDKPCWYVAFTKSSKEDCTTDCHMFLQKFDV